MVSNIKGDEKRSVLATPDGWSISGEGDAISVMGLDTRELSLVA